jgi:hypothetical protein
MAVSAFLLAVGHLLSTATFDLFVWTVLAWLVVRALRDGGRGCWAWVAKQDLGVAAAYLVLAGLFLVTGGKPYYLAGLYPVLWPPVPSRPCAGCSAAPPGLLPGIDNGVGLDNDEQGRPVWVCRDRLTPWGSCGLSCVVSGNSADSRRVAGGTSASASRRAYRDQCWTRRCRALSR